MKDNQNSILRTARLSLGMKSREAAEAIGVTKHTYLMWERGEMSPMPSKAEKVSKVLHLPVELVPVPSKHPPYNRRTTNESDPEKEKRIEKYTPYRDRRLELGLTQKELAEKAGVADTTISAMECGLNDPIWQTRQKIRKALGWDEEHYYTVEERNELILSMSKVFQWVINQHREYLREVFVDLEDAYQDLVLCAICAIDRYDPSGGAAVENYVISQLVFEVRNIRARAVAKGFTGRDARRLPFNTLISLEDANPFGDKVELKAVA